MVTEKFHYKPSTGPEIVLPRLSGIKAGIIRKYRNTDPVDFIFSILEDVADEKTLARVDALSVKDINEMFDQWQTDGGGVGESLGSST